MRRPIGFTIKLMIGCMLQLTFVSAHAQSGNPSNFVPDLTLSYIDPTSGERVECTGDCRRVTVPAGSVLEAVVEVHDEGDNNRADEVTWDLWFNQPNHPYPGLDIEACFGEDAGSLDRRCWQALLERVDRDAWDALVPDVVCVPVRDGDSCRRGEVRVLMNPDFEGARRPGVYHFAVWANRFSTIPERDEFDNFVGPIRVTVEARQNLAPSDLSAPDVGPQSGTIGNHAEVEGIDPDSPVMIPSLPMSYGVVIVPKEVETAFTVTATRSQRLLEFAPAYAGKVAVEVMQAGTFENMVVQVRKVSTGEVLIEARGKGRLRLEGRVDGFDLRDDPQFEVVVIPGQGSRGVRGSIRVSYPARLRYIVEP